MLRAFCMAALLTVGTQVLAATPAASPIRVTQAWIRATPPQASTAAGYLTVVNTGTQADRLVAVASALAERAEMHENSMAGGVMRMRKVEGVDLPAGATVVLAPSGTHLMFIAPRQPLVAGQQIQVTLSFAHAPAQQVIFKVVPLDAAPEASHQHMPGMKM